MTLSTILLVLTLLVGFGLSFGMPKQRSKLWSISLMAIIGGFFVVFAFTDPDYRYVSLFFALLAFFLAFRGWRERSGGHVTKANSA